MVELTNAFLQNESSIITTGKTKQNILVDSIKLVSCTAIYSRNPFQMYSIENFETSSDITTSTSRNVHE